MTPRARSLADLVATPPAKPSFVDHVAVRIDLIDVPKNRLRPANPDYVNLYAQKLQAGEEAPPIEVRPREDKAGRYWLIVGLHRLDSHRLDGRAEISARIFDVSEAEARLREIGENLHRAELSVLDRALNLAELKRVQEELHPETRHGATGRGRKRVAKLATLRFTAEAADRIGLSERVVQRAVALADALSSEAIEHIRGTYLADHGSDLQALARLKPHEQVRAAKAIANGNAKTLKDALPALGRGDSKADEQERIHDLMVSNLARASKRTRERVLVHWIEAFGPDELSHAQREAKAIRRNTNGGKGNGEAARQEPKTRA